MQNYTTLSLFVLFFCLYAYAVDIPSSCPATIRAQIIINKDRDDNNHWRELLSYQDELQQNGLIFVDENPDVILCNWVTEELLEKNTPIIILEINAAASLKNKTRKFLKYPQVKAVFKNRIFRDKTIYNQPHVQQTYFFAQVNDYAQLSQPVEYKPLTPEQLEKIQLVVWDLNWSPFNRSKFSSLVTRKIDSEEEDRPLDLFFAGRLMCNGKNMLQTFYNWHRTKAFEALKRLTDVRCEIIEGRALPFKEYLKAITTAKIVISPWGWGEWCYRDFETILSGTILIKPDTSFVLSYPDIYKNYETYIPCKPDFSDLEEKVQMILANYDYYKTLSKQAQHIIRACWLEYDQLLSRFVDAVRDTVKV